MKKADIWYNRIDNCDTHGYEAITKDGVVGFLKYEDPEKSNGWYRNKRWTCWNRNKDVCVQTSLSFEKTYITLNSKFTYIGNINTLAEAKNVLYESILRSNGETEEHKNAKYLPINPEAEFYPTPTSLAGKMIAKVDEWKGIRTILEPSAGKGDLVKAIKNMLNDRQYSRNRCINPDRVHFDLIEKDCDLGIYLRGAGYRLVADDFLSYNPLGRYDLIFMNPPFSNGDEHLLHAIDIQKNGGRIVCLLNAETIRNPCTIRRQELQKMLAKYAANVEFVKDAFKHSERPTDVEVAIISLNIPKRHKESVFYQNMKKVVDEERKNNSGPNAIAVGDEIESLIESYNLEAKTGIALIDEYEATKSYIMNGTDKYSRPIIEMKIDGKEMSYLDNPVNAFLHGLRYKYWSMLGDKPSIKSRMTSLSEVFLNIIPLPTA